jgi:hypothetical protein
MIARDAGGQPAKPTNQVAPPIAEPIPAKIAVAHRPPAQPIDEQTTGNQWYAVKGSSGKCVAFADTPQHWAHSMSHDNHAQVVDMHPPTDESAWYVVNGKAMVFETDEETCAAVAESIRDNGVLPWQPVALSVRRTN